MDYVWVVHGEEYAQQCADSIRSLDEESWPDCYVYVDQRYECLEELTEQEVIEGYHDQPFMLMNVLCQVAHLAGMDEGDLVCFLDSDVLQVDHPVLPEGDWDIAPTWRDDMGEFSDLMPYNYGVIFAKKTVQSLLGWAWMADNIFNQQPKNLKWYGNQVALRELCGAPEKDGSEVIREHGYFNIKIQSIPCQTHNYTPEAEDEDLTGKYFIHLKGDRKGMWDHYKGRVAA